MIRMPCDLPSRSRTPTGRPRSWRFSPRLPRSTGDPGRPAGRSPKRVLCVGFWGGNPIALCLTLFTGAVSRLGECGLPGGLRGALGPLHLLRSALPWGFLHSCHTRSEWWVRPCSAGTCTPQEAPSFAWRTNVPRQPPGATVALKPTSRPKSHRL
jgi:hypothetical protein